MSRHARIVLSVVAAVVMALFVGVASWVKMNSRDIPAPDTSDLLIRPIEVADENNAFTYFCRATDVFSWPKDDSRVVSMLTEEEWDDAYVSDLLARNAEALACVKRGLACPAYQPYGASAADNPNVAFRSVYHMARLMILRSVQERRNGRIESAWHACTDLLDFASFVAARPWDMVSHAVGVTALEGGLGEARQLLDDFDPNEALLLRLSDHLGRTHVFDEGWVRAIQTEFQFVSRAIDDPHATSTRHGPLSRYMYQPNRTRQMGAEYLRQVAWMGSQPYGQLHPPEFEPLPESKAFRRLLVLRPNSVGRILLATTTASPEQFMRIFARTFRVQSDLEGLRLVVASRLYEMREGRLPETLEELVPQYLSEVPRDPFDAKSFRYIRERGIVYSVGIDLKDSSASIEPMSDETPSSRARRGNDDLVYPIHGKAE